MKKNGTQLVVVLTALFVALIPEPIESQEWSVETMTRLGEEYSIATSGISTAPLKDKCLVAETAGELLQTKKEIVECVISRHLDAEPDARLGQAAAHFTPEASA